MEYFDKNGEQVRAGMTIKHKDGDVEKVYASDDDLGINASNEKHISFSEFNREIYPLYQMDMREWVIIKPILTWYYNEHGDVELRKGEVIPVEVGTYDKYLLSGTNFYSGKNEVKEFFYKIGVDDYEVGDSGTAYDVGYLEK